MTLYQLRNITQTYQTRTVLHIDALDICQGEILAIVGPSGAGKSTLLRLLNFLEHPTSGHIRFLDTCIAPGDTPPLALRRKITTVFQRPVLLNRSVRANVAYGLQLRRVNQRAIATHVEEALDSMGLTHLANARAQTLSGGEMQRVAVARALVLDPLVLLMDEPTANLDPYNVKVIEEIVQHTHQERKTTIVLVTHNVFQAKRLAHRTVLLLNGQLVEIGETATFFNTPTDPRTAAFVRGDMIY